MPTAIVLSAREGTIGFDESGRLTVSEDNRLRVVDGMHRKEGFRDAVNARGMEDMLDFEVPVSILAELSRPEEMRQFRVINGTAKSVRTDLVSMILGHLSAAEKESDLDDRDQWSATAAKIVKLLNETKGSPWFGRITLPNQEESRFEQVTKATSVISSIRPIDRYFAEGLGKKFRTTDDRAQAIGTPLVAFWNAVQQLLPACFENPTDFVLLKTQGLFALNLICRNLMRELFSSNEEWTTHNFKRLLAKSDEMQDASFWHVGRSQDGIQRGPAANFAGMKGFADLAETLWLTIDPQE